MAGTREILPRTMIVSGCTLASRVLGLVRDVVTTSVFGASTGLDLFVVAFTVPNLFRALFGEGALSSAVVPVLRGEFLDPEKDERLLLRALMGALVAILVGFTILAWIACASLATLGHLSSNGRLLCRLLAIVLPYMPLICATALLGAALNARGRFFAPAASPILLNLCWIVAAWGFGRRFGVYALAVGVVVAGLMQFSMQVPFIHSLGWSVRPLWDWSHPGLRRVARLMIPAVLGLGIVQVNVALDRVIAQLFAKAGANSVLFVGNRLMQFPLGVFGIALATAAFPTMADRAARGDRAGLLDGLDLASRMALFIALPAMAVMLSLNLPLVRLLFEHGRFSSEASERTARVLFWYGTGFWAFCTAHVLTRGFHAQQDTSTPVRIGALVVGLNLALNLALVRPMGEAGLALASSIAGTVNVIWLAIALRRRLGRLNGRRTVRTLTRGVPAAAVAGACGYGVARLVGNVLGADASFHGTTGARLATVCAGMVAVLLLYACLAWLLRMSEIRDLAAALVRRKKRDEQW